MCVLSETGPIKKENEVALQQAEMRMVRWMRGMKLQDRVPTKGLRERLGLDDIISVLQQNRLQWYGHVLRKEDNDWVKKCMKYEVLLTSYLTQNRSFWGYSSQTISWLVLRKKVKNQKIQN